MGTVAFRTAQKEVENYRSELRQVPSADANDQLLRNHNEAMEAQDCEDFLQLGIESLGWLEKTRANILELVRGGRAVYDPDLEAKITDLYEEWLGPYARAEEWANEQVRKGFRIANLKAFKDSFEQAKDVLESRRLYEASRRARIGSPGEEEW